VLAAIVLIVAGLGILWAARDAGSVNADFARWRAQRTSSERWRRYYEWQARVTPKGTVWYGRAIAALAFIGAAILLLRR
jgi:hypothetical protein